MSAQYPDFTERIQAAGGTLELPGLQEDFLRWEGSSSEHFGSVMCAAMPVNTPAELQLEILADILANRPEYRARYDRWNLLRFHYPTILTHVRSATP